MFKASRSLGASSDADTILRRELVGQAPLPALLNLMLREPDVRAGFLPELLVALIHGPTNLILVVRDSIRCCPRSALEEGIPAAMEPLLAVGDDESFYRISEVLVELRLDAALDRLVEMAGDHSDPDVRDLVRRNEGIAGDPQRWGRLVQEWPIQEVG
jgi:hypothetical protein